MDVHASLRHLHMSPRKVRLVTNAIRGLSVAAAETRLRFMSKQAALPVLKLLRSAIANAEHNFHAAKEGLIIKKITADGGPTFKRFRPRAFGRAAPIRHRTTHIMLTLETQSANVKTQNAETEKKGSAKTKSARSHKLPATS